MSVRLKLDSLYFQVKSEHQFRFHMNLIYYFSFAEIFFDSGWIASLTCLLELRLNLIEICLLTKLLCLSIMNSIQTTES